MQILDRSPISPADWLVTIDVLPNVYWETGSEIRRVINRPKRADGLTAIRRYTRQGTRDFADMELSISYDPNKDGSIIRFLGQYENGNPFTCTMRPVVRDVDIRFTGGIVGFGTEPTVTQGNAHWLLSGCIILGWNTSPINIGGENAANDTSMITMQMGITNAQYSV